MADGSPSGGLPGSQEILAAIVQSATDAIVVLDDGQRILLFNGSAERMFQCAAAEALGGGFERFVAPRVRVEFAAWIDRWRRSDPQTGHLETVPTAWALRAGGDEFPCEASFTEQHVGGRRLITLFIRDISERKRAERALRRRMEFDAFLFDLSRTFIGLPEGTLDVHMEHGLARVGAFLQMDRITLLELSADREELVVAYSWSSTAAVASAPRISKRMLPWWVGQVLHGEVTLTSGVNDLPEGAAGEKEYLRARNVASAASIPLKVGGEIAGAISFVTTIRHVSWTEELINQLRAIGDILWNALKRRQAMQALLDAQALVRESEARFRLMANTAPVKIWMTDADQEFTYVNQRWLTFTGGPIEADLGTGWMARVHPDDVERVKRIRSQAFTRPESYDIEFRLRRHDGEFRWIFAQGVPRFNPDRSFAGYIGSAIDVTARKEAESALSTLSQRLIQAEEQESARLARELHDDINQRLALLVLNLETVKARYQTAEPSLGRDVQEAIDAAATLTSDVQALSHRLHSSKLSILGLEVAARDLCREFTERRHVDIEFRSKGAARTLPEDISVCLYRVLQEALQNAIKHSGSRQIAVALDAEPKEVTLVVEDSGVGFDPAAALKGRGLGLLGMKERLKLVSGELTIDARSPGGTTIRARVPLDEAA